MNDHPTLPRFVLLVLGIIVYAGNDVPPTIGLVNFALYEHTDGSYCLVACDCPFVLN